MGIQVASCSGQGNILGGMKLWGPEFEPCGGFSAWGTYSGSSFYVTQSEQFCSCRGHGSLTGRTFWGKKGDACMGLPAWGTYSQDCRSASGWGSN